MFSQRRYASWCDISLNFWASVCFIGSLSYIQSTFVAFIIRSQFSSMALITAAKSFVQYGFQVQAVVITILLLSRCLSAFCLLKVETTLGASIADNILVSKPALDKISPKAIQFINVAIMPI